MKLDQSVKPFLKKPCRIMGILLRLMMIASMAGLVGCAPPADSEEITLGVVWPFSDYNALFSEGIDLAAKEINAGGGINGRKLLLLKADDGSEVEKGIALAESFAENQAVLAVIGHRNSFVSIPAAAIYEEAGLAMLSPGSTAPELTQKGYRHILRNIPSDDEIARQLAIYLAGLGHRRMVVYYSADAYGVGLANSFEDHAKGLGITIVDRLDYYAGVEDLKRLRDRWRAFGFDGVLVASSMPEGAQFIFDAGRAGIQGPFVAGDGLNSPELAVIGGQAAEGTVVVSIFNPESDRAEARQFVAAFQAAYGKTPNSHAALGYDAVRMLAAALEKSGAQSREAVGGALRDLGRWPGAAGVHELSAAGDELGDLALFKQLVDGKFVYLTE